MTPETWAAIAAAGGAWAAALVSIVSAIFTGVQVKAVRKQTGHQERAADAANEQTKLQRQIARDAAQPYVWVDVRADEAQGSAFNLLLGNSGPTFAHNIRATIDPPLPSDNSSSAKGEAAQRRLREGIKSLGPGHRLVWFIGIGRKIVEEDVPQLHTITIEAEGPYGPVGPLTYDLDLADFRETRDAPEGNLYFVRKAIEKIEEKLPSPKKPLRVVVEGRGDEQGPPKSLVDGSS
ncbi:hypothetical protein [Halostreptopolyspora alba]|uniref:Uncharacterized protein n=1 Tax=Halostreptopolyspora alba TaxID=2487137 RepID=A0A3N0EAC4_9ACTN|nr:hypothetical protein EFW17_10785 [Nocardiopsaceae bacterium YIM 96095]